MKNQINKKSKDIFSFCKEIWNFPRSLSGKGVRKTLKHIKIHLENLKVKSFKSGKTFFDWKVPDEWEIKDAWLKDENGNTILSFKKNNLHVVGYSVPVNKKINLDELQNHLHSRSDLEEAIPYVTSYYRDDWGFCISHKERKNLKNGIYHAFINSRKYKGAINVGELVLPGKNKSEILLSTNICHPAMANNEISGIALTTWLGKWLSSKNLNHTYRILFLPETIGSISYLANHLDHLKKNVVAGLNIVCVGDEGDFSYLPSRSGNEKIDKVIKDIFLKSSCKLKKYSWLERGSDERQYCSPGVDLPVASLMRSKYGEYEEYHTSLDKLGSVVTRKGLLGSLKMYKKVINQLESLTFPISTNICEPHLLKYNLSHSLGGIEVEVPKFKNKTIRDFITYSDGRNTLEDIAKLIGISFVESKRLFLKLKKMNLVN